MQIGSFGSLAQNRRLSSRGRASSAEVPTQKQRGTALCRARIPDLTAQLGPARDVQPVNPQRRLNLKEMESEETALKFLAPDESGGVHTDGVYRPCSPEVEGDLPSAILRVCYIFIYPWRASYQSWALAFSLFSTRTRSRWPAPGTAQRTRGGLSVPSPCSAPSPENPLFVFFLILGGSHIFHGFCSSCPTRALTSPRYRMGGTFAPAADFLSRCAYFACATKRYAVYPCRNFYNGKSS